MMQNANAAPTQRQPRPDTRVDWQDTDPWIKVGKRIVLWAFGGLLLWSALISISGAVVTGGTVTVESSYQDIQSLEGGIVTNIAVKNGERVAQGQTLVQLDNTTAQTNARAIAARVNDLTIKQARLVAERDNKDSFDFPPSVPQTDTAANTAYVAQTALFESRKRIRASSQQILAERIMQLEGELKGLTAQRNARAEQLKINETELSTVMPLFERGYVSQQRLSPLKRESARLAGDVGQFNAQISKTQSALHEARLQKDQNDKQFMSEVLDELGRIQASLAEEREKLTRLNAALARTDIKAPKAGRVHAISVKTIGGVVAPGARIMQIIPEGERLVVSAEVAPGDIDQVRPGQSAAILFPAFNARTTPRLQGKVSKVSPAEQEHRDGRKYFTARIEIPSTELAKIDGGHRMVPGMPAEVFIETTPRTILSYLLKPLTDTMDRAMRER